MLSIDSAGFSCRIEYLFRNTLNFSEFKLSFFLNIEINRKLLEFNKKIMNFKGNIPS